MGKEMKIVEFPTNCGLSGMMHHVIALTLHSVELKKPRDYILEVTDAFDRVDYTR